MIIETFIVTAFAQNARVVACEKTKMAICIDPGAEAAAISDYIDTNHFDLQAITLTHAHLDHIGGTAELHRFHPAAEIILHKDDEKLYYALPEQPAALGIPREAWESLGLAYEMPPRLTRLWQDGEVYKVGELNFEILHCPGHTPGHVVLAEKLKKTVFAGDCLFHGSIGRTDLPGGSHVELINSIKTKILTLGDDFRVCTGHGEDTTIGAEKLHNPFLK